MAFSGALTLTDLNDFITPSQACIKPVEEVKAPQEFPDQGVASTQIHIDSSGSYYEVATYTEKNGALTNPARKLETAQISLNDCLACSGCITSAESVLITLQSHEEVLNVLASNPPVSSPQHRMAVLSIAPQSLASLAASVSSSSSAPVTSREILHRVQAFAQELGFDRVYDTTFARHVSLLEHTREFRERQVASAQTQGRPAGPCVNAPLDGCGSKKEVNGYVHAAHVRKNTLNGKEAPQNADAHDKPDGSGRLPMLAGACPGWVCYAEKTHAEMLPFLSRTKSPQQVMGTLVKQWFAPKWGKKPNEVYHVTVMPCYDKKLEASRPDFFDDVHATRDVDCVITTGELDRMMRERGWNIARPLPVLVLKTEIRKHENEAEAVIEQRKSDDAEPQLPSLLTHPGTSSGSYLHSLLASYITASPSLSLTSRTLRSADYEEYTLTDPTTGRVVFRGARCYGFRNLQNLVRKVGREAGVQVGRGAAGKLGGARARGAAARVVRARKMKEKEKDGAAAERNGQADPSAAGATEEPGYDYVEVMACPGGCVNGGGQLRPPSTSTSTTESEPVVQTRTTDVDVGQDSNESGLMQNAARWGDKAWVKQVEAAYWHDLPTPPASPSPSASIPLPESESSTPSNSSPDTQKAEADALALRVLTELCHPHSSRQIKTWDAPLDARAEAARRRFFRTDFRAVESEVAGIQVKW